MTEYVVFQGYRDELQPPGGAEVWLPIGEVNAHSAKAAIRHFARQHGEVSRIAATPKRSWEAVTIERETIEQLRIS